MADEKKTVLKCGICKREMNTADLSTTNCGGDCRLCMAECGDPDEIANILSSLRNKLSPDPIRLAQIICNSMVDQGIDTSRIPIRTFIVVAEKIIEGI